MIKKVLKVIKVIKKRQNSDIKGEKGKKGKKVNNRKQSLKRVNMFKKGNKVIKKAKDEVKKINKRTY